MFPPVQPQGALIRSKTVQMPKNEKWALCHILHSFVLQFLCLKMYVYGTSMVLQRGGWGTLAWQPSPRGRRGSVFPGVRQDRGGGGYCVTN